jgi:hypothetical protein
MYAAVPPSPRLRRAGPLASHLSAEASKKRKLIAQKASTGHCERSVAIQSYPTNAFIHNNSGLPRRFAPRKDDYAKRESI